MHMASLQADFSLILDKIGYNSACVRDMCENFEHLGGFRGWAIECCQSHFPRPTPVAMATKCGTKLAITLLVQQILPRSLHLTRCGLRVWQLVDVSRSPPQATLISRYNEQQRMSCPWPILENPLKR